MSMLVLKYRVAADEVAEGAEADGCLVELTFDFDIDESLFSEIRLEEDDLKRLSQQVKES